MFSYYCDQQPPATNNVRMISVLATSW